MKRLDKGAIGMSLDQVIARAADKVDRAFPRGVPQDGARGGRDLRLSESGDVNEAGARRFAKTEARWRARGGGAVFTYTHRWQEIPREAFGAIHVAASVETIEAADEAYEAGYLPALVVSKFERKTPYLLEGSRHGLKGIPCPFETREKRCVECRLCLGKAPKNSVILFAAHGSGKKKVVEQLTAANELVRRKR